MATTSFDLTPDSSTITTGGASILGGDVTQAVQRYAEASLLGTYSYPQSDNIDGFYVPRMTFKFFDAFGKSISRSPTVKVRVPNNFNVTNFSDYSRTEAIFGSGMEGLAQELYKEVGTEKIGEQAGGSLNVDDVTNETLLKYGATASEAFLYALQKSLAGATGFISSGGLNAISQAEFTNRAAVNPYAQLLYKGPQFRRYQVPVSIKPRNSTESENALNIIRVFKIASSPSIQNRNVTIGSFQGTLQSFVFGYPHLTQFTIDFSSPTVTANRTIFESKLCAIESVAVDYGGQKMSFFEDGIPSEITLTLQLSEIAVRTLGDARNDSINKRTIL
jgi:hypothetical protein